MLLDYARTLNTLKQLESIGYTPTVDVANDAAHHGRWDILEWLESKQIYSRYYVETMAVRTGRLDILTWLYDKGILPTIRDACDASTHGHLDILKWMEQHGILPDARCADHALSNGHIDIVQWLEGRGIFATGILGYYTSDENKALMVLNIAEQKGLTLPYIILVCLY